MSRLARSWALVWAIGATLLLVISIGSPERTQMALRSLSHWSAAPTALAQTPESPAQLEWLGWQFFRLTSPRGKIILFNPALNDPRAAFRNRESPLNLDDITAAHLILPADGHADDQGMTVEIAKKTGALVITTFELGNWMVGQGVPSEKILRSQPGFRFEVEGIKIQVVNSVHGSGAPPLPGQSASVYGGPAQGYIVTLENGVRIYHAGSTALTQDLQLYGRLYKPHVALLPIAGGGQPDDAALAAEFLRTDNPNLHSVFPQHHLALPPSELAGLFVHEVQSR
ncbi:MAG TPA: MBL fold metallo-hydrolase, partial [bacterium]|nr:MBL fold metallo-hydrolase [bacterium]